MTHLIALEGSEWRWWRWFRLRSAGFPFAALQRLVAPAAAAAADHVMRAFEASALARDAALEVLSNLDGASEEERALLLFTARRIRENKPLTARSEPLAAIRPEAWAAAQRWQTSLPDLEEAERVFDASFTETRRVLRSIVAEDSVREAILWQSLSASQAIGRLINDGTPQRNYNIRTTERLALMYLQRYLAKNDSIGFFGPSALGLVSDAAFVMRCSPGDELIDRRRVFFEHWAMRAVASRLEQHPEVRGSLVPRLSPLVRLDGDVLFHPIERRTLLEPRWADFLRAIDGRRSVATLAGEFEDAASMLDELEAQGIVIRQIEIDTARFDPERFLPVPPALEAARQMLSTARGFAARSEALEEVSRSFVAVSGVDPKRKSGETYAGRTIVYEDCTRAFGALELGGEFLREISPVLDLVFATARSCAVRLEDRAIAEADQVFDGIGGAQVDAQRFFSEFNQRLSPEWWSEAQRPSQHLWLEALAIPEKASRISRSAAELAIKLSPLEGLRRPRWPHARCHSPDLMIAAESVEAISRGEYSVVLGELHANENTVNLPLAVALYEELAPLMARAMAEDCGRLVHPVMESEKMFRAAAFLRDTGTMIELEHGKTRSGLPRNRVVRLGELFLFRSSEGLRFATLDRRLELGLLEMIDYPLTVISGAGLDLLPPRQHLPRVTVDRVVISRERWIGGAPPLGGETFAGFCDARRWAAELGLPRRFFVKTPSETKPMMVDLDSPLLVDAFTKLADKDRGARLKFSEMLPDPAQLWLADAEGRRYTSELRLVAVES